ncbi:MAG: hypothetical protein IPI49_32950 [Myxococcales bacterium]|nr:hypothetical protein [Myxococcales bacterium]
MSSLRKSSATSLAMFLAATSSVFALMGCAMEEEGTEPTDLGVSQDDALAETEQAVSATGLYHYQCTTGNCAFDLGTTTGRSCFLGGISGSLDQGGATIYAIVGGTYRLSLIHAPGQRIGATAVCVAPKTNAITASWRGGQSATPINGTVTSSRRCFLTGISNTSGYVRGFDTASDYAQVWKDPNGQWFLGGSLAGGADTWASAVCLDLPVDQGIWGIVAGAGSTVGFNLAYNSNGVACGLSKLGGKFLTNSFSDKLGIDYDAGTRYWNIKAVNSKQATAVCYQ